MFKNWNSFAKSLSNSSATVNPRTDGGPIVMGLDSISGPVTITIKSSNSVIETFPLVFPIIKGTSNTNTLKIDGNYQTLNCNIQYAVFRFTGIDYLTIQNLNIVNSSAEPGGFWFNNQSDYNTISGCSLNFSTMVSASQSTYFLSMSTSVLYPTLSGYTSNNASGPPGSFNTITSNTFYTSATNSVGPYCGISLNGSHYKCSTIAQNNTFTGNKIQNFSYYAIYQLESNGNVISNNDISRVNTTAAPKSGMKVLYNQDCYSYTRSAEFSRNNLHDLPFGGATGNSTPLSFTEFLYNLNCYGTVNYPIKFNENTISNFYSSSLYLMRFYNSQYIEINKNSIKNIESKNTLMRIFSIESSSKIDIQNNEIQNISFKANSGNFEIIYLTNISGFRCNGNLVKKCTSASTLTCYYFNLCTSGNANWCEFIDNSAFQNISILGTKTVFVNNFTNINHMKIIRNFCVGNISTGNTGFTTFQISDPCNIELIGNVIAGNSGNSNTINISEVFNNTLYNAEIRNNTFQINTSKSPNAANSEILCKFSLSQHHVYFTGNIVELQGSGTKRIFDQSYNTLREFNDNTYFINKQFKTNIWNFNGKVYSDWSDFQGSGNCGNRDNGEDPKYIDTANHDWRPTAFNVLNNVPYFLKNEFDCKKIARNKIHHDRGGLETPLDLQAISTNLNLPINVCSGYSLTECYMIVKSRYPFGYTEGFKVSYTINNGPKKSTSITKKLYFGDTVKVYFPQPITLNKLGANILKFFVDIPDDTLTNDTLIYHTVVISSPSGSTMLPSNSPTLAQYQPSKNFDVTILGQAVEYKIGPPKGFNNLEYFGNGTGNKWKATVMAKCKYGKAISGCSLNPPIGTSDMKVKFVTNDPSLEDSTIVIHIKITDNINGCDSTITREIFIYPKIVVNFMKPKRVCVGESICLENWSTVSSGKMEFFWDFGNKADSSRVTSPKYSYKNTGTYIIKLIAKTIPYGFISMDSAIVQVVEAPIASFSHLNACEGKNLSFTNLSSPKSAVIHWDFGDLSGTSSESNPIYKYNSVGTYKVTLTAELLGCKDTQTVQVYQLSNPVVFFSASSTCAGLPIQFQNLTKWDHGNIQYDWDFSDNTHSTDENPTHTYNIQRTTTYNITLKAILDEGCNDSFTLQITVHEGPKTCDFVATPDYAYGFYGIKLEPVNSMGTVGAQKNINYTWTLETGEQQTGPSAQFNLTADGLYKVTMKAVSDESECECSKTKEVEMNRTNSEDLEQSEIQIYPNPANEYITLMSTELFGSELTVQLINLQGQLAKSIQCKNGDSINMNTSNLSNGIYWIKVVGQSKSTTRKIVIIH